MPYKTCWNKTRAPVIESTHRSDFSKERAKNTQNDGSKSKKTKVEHQDISEQDEQWKINQTHKTHI